MNLQELIDRPKLEVKDAKKKVTKEIKEIRDGKFIVDSLIKLIYNSYTQLGR
jgi:hypothetical protein